MDSRPDVAIASRPARRKFLFINKTASSASLSHSQGFERIKLLSTAQRTSRRSLRENESRAVQSQTTCSRGYLACSSYDSLQGLEGRSKPSGIAQSQLVSTTPPSAAVNRIQLCAHFLESYYPACMPGQVRVVDTLRQWIEPKRGAVAFAAADCIILLHTAQAIGDETLRKHGMLSYHKALQLLRHKLQSPESAHDDSVLGAVEIMGVVETRLLKSSDRDFDALKRAHTSGLYALLLARGPSILRSNMGKNILLQHLHELLMVSLLSRTASVFGNSDWQTAFRIIGHGDTGTMRQLTVLGCCIPQVLERADVLINDDASTNVQYTDLLTKLIVLEDCFLRWLRDHYQKFSREKPYQMTAASLSTSFYNQSATLQESYAFPAVIEYRSFMDALAHLNYWGLLLTVRRTILDVLTARESTTTFPATSEQPSQEVRARCNEVADLFCQSACYIYRLPEHQSMIAKQGIVAFLIAIIVPWYSYDQDEKKFKWCSMLLQTFQKDHTNLDLVETIQHTWTTKLYIGWINMAF